jgi:hypothetical protein
MGGDDVAAGVAFDDDAPAAGERVQRALLRFGDVQGIVRIEAYDDARAMGDARWGEGPDQEPMAETPVRLLGPGLADNL